MKLKKFITNHKEEIVVFLLLLIAFVLRAYHLNTDLLFHRDQGLHSLAIWRLWHDKKISLLGHPSDVNGLIHAPIYYWLMTPAYALSSGSPVVASLFQISFEVLALPFFYLALKKLFDRQIALSTLAIYTVSYGFICYSRWLVNVTPILPFTHLLLFFLVSDRLGEYRPWRLAIISLLVGIITQLNAAIGTFLLPLLFWLYKKPFSWQRFLIIIAGFSLPALPLLVFELRHSFVLTQAFLRFSNSSSQGLSLAADSFSHNLAVLLQQLRNLFSYPVGLLSGVLFFLGLYKLRRLKHSVFIYSFLIVPFLSLALFRRHAIGFFFISLLPLALAVAVYGLNQLPKIFSSSILGLVLILNLSHLPLIYKPTNALIPIGSQNLITIKDRQNIIDWIYQKANGQDFALWYYTIPYFQEEVWDYMFLYYARPKYDYLPEATSGFSPGDLKYADMFFSVYEPDKDDPTKRKNWLRQAVKNFGPIEDSYHSHDLYVQLHASRSAQWKTP